MLAKLFAVLAYLVGLAGAGIFYAYVVGAGTGIWPRDDGTRDAVAWNFALLTIFAIQHSGMQRRQFWLLPAHLDRSAYVAASGTVLGLVTIFWQPLPGDPIWDGPIWIVGISLLGALGIAVVSRWFDHAAFFGLRQAWTGAAEVHGPLVVRGPYRFVRHPLMLCLLVALWGQPIMPPELLMMNVGMTLYIWMGTQFEEIRLVREFGTEYEKYRSRVPALIPWKWW